MKSKNAVVKVLYLLGLLLLLCFVNGSAELEDEDLQTDSRHTVNTFAKSTSTEEKQEDVKNREEDVKNRQEDVKNRQEDVKNGQEDVKNRQEDVKNRDIVQESTFSDDEPVEPGKTDDELIAEHLELLSREVVTTREASEEDEPAAVTSEDADDEDTPEHDEDILDEHGNPIYPEEELLDIMLPYEEEDLQAVLVHGDEEYVGEEPTEEEDLTLNGMPPSETPEEVEKMQKEDAESITPLDHVTHNPFEEVGAVPPPKVHQTALPGDSELHEAEEILGLRQSNKRETLQLQVVVTKPNYRKAYALLQKATSVGNDNAKVLLGLAHLTGEHVPYVTHNTSLAFELFENAAKSGFPAAQQVLGAMYSGGLETDSSQSKALLYYTFAALGGDALAQMALAFRYWSGISVAQSCESALKYYTLVADSVARKVGSAGTGQLVLRIRLMEEEESPQNSPILDEDLVQYYQFLADKGDLQAQLGLGQLYLQGGRGIDRNVRLAQHYFNAAAKSGNNNAYGYLGKISMNLKEYDVALKFFKLATKDPQGQWGMGTLYYHGWGVDQDYTQALSYFTLAAQQGHTEAELQLGVMHLSGIGVKKDYGVALKHFNIASKSGHVLAFYNLGMMHANGVGVMRNCQTAAELLKNVAERGAWGNNLMDAHALYHKGFIDSALIKYLLLAEQGYEVAQTNATFILDREDTDFITALKYRYKRAFVNWKRAATQGFGGARLKLGDYYYYGQGTDSDPSEAAEQYQLASDVDHNPQAMFNLGYMHELGIGRQQDMHLAKRYYDLAASTSLDAHIPATLANTRLQAKIHIDWIIRSYQDFTLTKLLDYIVLCYMTLTANVVGAVNSVAELLLQLDSTASEDWDIYLMSILAIILGLVMAVRGHGVRAAQLRQQQQQQQQQNQQNQPLVNQPPQN